MYELDCVIMRYTQIVERKTEDIKIAISGSQPYI